PLTNIYGLPCLAAHPKCSHLFNRVPSGCSESRSPLLCSLDSKVPSFNYRHRLRNELPGLPRGIYFVTEESIHTPWKTSCYGFSITLRLVIGLSSLSVKRRHPDQSIFSLTTLNTTTLTPFCSVTFWVLSWSLSAGRAVSFLKTSLRLMYTLAWSSLPVFMVRSFISSSATR